MRKSIQLAYDEWFDLNCSFAAKAGFKEVSVILADILDKTEEEWDREIDKIGEVLNKHGLWCSQSHPFFYDLRVSSEKTDERYEFSMRQAVRASAKLGAEWCVFHPRTSITSGFSVKQAFEDNRRSISTYLEVAKKYGTGIAIENLSIFSEFVPSGFLWGGCLRCAQAHCGLTPLCRIHLPTFQNMQFQNLVLTAFFSFIRSLRLRWLCHREWIPGLWLPCASRPAGCDAHARRAAPSVESISHHHLKKQCIS